MKQEAKQREQEEEQIYARLWEEDQAAKCKREEIEAAMQIERNREMLKVLTLQMAAVEKQKEEMRELKEKEAQLLREENALRAMEERREKEEKRSRQSETKCDLDYSLKLKMKKKTREIQEELALDMKLLEQMLHETSNEAMLHLQKKNTLKEEIQLYRSYLAEAKREERQREQELDSLLTAEVEKQWAKRTQQWRKEREARRKLMDDVLKTRRQQIKEKLAVLEEEKKAAAVERDTLIANYKQHLQIEKEQQESRKKANAQYQASLRDQMAYQQRRVQQEAAKMFRELEMAAREEALYQERLKAALSNPMLDKAHPRKLMATKK
ncbi:Cilia- and flagella-associated protein 53 [Geodia barretti]|nr:Cilia- and flagella-associated protein 53 [Geodia barretti]